MGDEAIWIDGEGGLDRLLSVLRANGFTCYGPVERDGTTNLSPVSSSADMPRGRVMETEGGTVRTVDGDPERWFDKTLPMQGLKRFVYPARETLLRVEADFTVTAPAPATEKAAVIGARACDLAALGVLDVVFRDGTFEDPRYAARRAGLIIVAVDCAVPLETCFCASMGTGPHAREHFDLALTELYGDDVPEGGHGFLVRAGSEAGRELLAALEGRPATPDMKEAKAVQADGAAAAMTRQMPSNAADVVRASHDSPHWADVAARCLSCANCTMVCPTCFCSTVEDRNDLDGASWRERRWDSCFSIDFSYIHGGPVRRGEAARYRQWMTHKLGHWHDQFGMSGCVGCGRCIAWCPVGIDITAEARALAAEAVRQHGGA